MLHHTVQVGGLGGEVVLSVHSMEGELLLRLKFCGAWPACQAQDARGLAGQVHSLREQLLDRIWTYERACAACAQQCRLSAGRCAKTRCLYTAAGVQMHSPAHSLGLPAAMLEEQTGRPLSENTGYLCVRTRESHLCSQSSPLMLQAGGAAGQ